MWLGATAPLSLGLDHCIYKLWVVTHELTLTFSFFQSKISRDTIYSKSYIFFQETFVSVFSLCGLGCCNYV